MGGNTRACPAANTGPPRCLAQRERRGEYSAGPLLDEAAKAPWTRLDSETLAPRVARQGDVHRYRLPIQGAVLVTGRSVRTASLGCRVFLGHHLLSIVMPTISQHLAVALLLALALSGCAAPDLRALESATYAGAKPCCASAKDRPAAAALSPENVFELTGAAPHFDFGFGLAPFASFRLDSSVKFLGLLSKPQGPQPFEFADLRPIFFDAQDKQLPPAPMTPPIVRTHGAMGWYALTRYVAVPPGAAVVVVTTGSVNAGKSAVASGSVPGGGIMLGNAFIPLAGGTLQFPYVHSIYGSGWLLALEAAPR